MAMDSEFLMKVKSSPFLVLGFIWNSLFMANRILQRFYCVQRVYGTASAAWVPLRTPIANIVNAFAAMRAIYQYVLSKASGVAPQWVKTEHELPAGFGVFEDEVEGDGMSQEVEAG
jgi:adsorption protein B